MFGTVLSGLRAPAAGLLAALLAYLPAYAPAAAEPAGRTDRLELALPMDCAVGVDCWVANYIDHDPLAGAKDYTCGPLTYDGHGGSDFAVRDFAAVRRGVAVLAAADGIVARVRDGMKDGAYTAGRKPRGGDRDCGNGVFVTHAGGWTTQYCHMRRGSVSVEPKQSVVQGQPLGMVGQSGKAAFPHVHFNVRRNGRRVDPFTGVEAERACGSAPAPLWRRDLGESLKYRPFAIYNAGFAAGRPDLTRIRDGRHAGGRLPPSAPALTLWVEIFGLRKGDRLRFRIIGPDGGIVHDRRTVAARRYARWFGVSGRRRAADWPKGVYVGEVTLVRQGPGGALTGSIRRETEIR